MHYEPAKQKPSVMASVLYGKRIVWQDKTNFNVWCTQSTGWSHVGHRAVAARCTFKDQNLQMIGAIAIEIANFKIFRESFPPDPPRGVSSHNSMTSHLW